MNFWTRRFIYLIFALALSYPTLTGWRVTPDVGPEAQHFYDAIERVPMDKIVLINLQFEGSSLPENGPQTHAIFAHLMKRGLRFAIISLDPISPGLGQPMAEELGRKYNRPYGQYWCNLGYKVGGAAVIKGMARDLPGVIGKDMRGTRFSDIPAMKGVHDASDVGLLIDVDPTATYAEWLKFFAVPYHLPFAVAPTSVMISDLYPFLDSGQITGMLKGIAGAAQYERLVGEPGEGYARRMPIFMAHMTIILLILVGNAADLFRRWRRP